MTAATDTRLHVGLVHNWPGARNSEFDLILRISRVLRRLGHSATIVDPVGTVLDEQGDRLEVAQQPSSFDLTLNLHYLNPKYLAGLSYTVNWNPIDYLVKDPITRLPLPIKQQSFIVDCFRSHDRVLSAGSYLVDQFARLARFGWRKGWMPEADLRLHTTIESQASDGWRLAGDVDFKVFYIGINWEKMSASPDKRVRHAGLFELLDQSRRFEFYGLREQAGVPLWDGVVSYKGELPFDGGHSIVQKCRECGAALVLSSEQHRASGVVSTRIFQAAAAGVVIITDRNPFIVEQFGHSVVYFDYGESDNETAQSILKCVEWIEGNWGAACEMAAAAQAIFEQRFALEGEIARLCEQAERDLAARSDWAAGLSSSRVHIVYRPEEYAQDQCEAFFENLRIQVHGNLVATISAPKRVLPEFAKSYAAADLPFAVEFRAAEADHTLGALLTRVITAEDHFAVVYSDRFIWREDHLFCLLDTIEKEDADFAYVPLFREDCDLKSGADMMAFFIHGMDGGFGGVTESNIGRFDMNGFPLGNLLWRVDSAWQLEQDYSFLPQFDVASVYALIFVSHLKNRKVPALVPGITSRYMGSAASWIYDEYSSGRYMDRFARQLDRNAFYGFFRHLPGAESIVDFGENLADWEYEQLEGDFVPSAPPIASKAELLREVGRMRDRRSDSAGAARVAAVAARLGDRAKAFLRRSPQLYRMAVAVRGSVHRKRNTR